MKLHELKAPTGSRHSRKRLGRGDASGHGGTSTRGHKGHKSRSGFHLSFNFEGGQMSLTRRLPKRGFTHLPYIRIETVNLKRIDRVFPDGATVTPDALKEAGLIKKTLYVKVLGDGALTKKLNIQAHAFSGKAKSKIEKSGGQAALIAPPARPEAKKPEAEKTEAKKPAAKKKEVKKEAKKEAKKT